VLNPRSTPDAWRGAGRPGDATSAVPGFVPAAFAQPIARAARRWSVSASLLAAQLYAESNFNPFAESPAGARGIAQFMPGTAPSYGLSDPFDPAASIDAQAHLMRDLLRRFASPPLALAAYNAGPVPVERCGCVPDIPETQAYVARVIGLLAGAGAISSPVPALEVQLIS
jgi:soluble lytic murein transglycosylase-like protein